MGKVWNGWSKTDPTPSPMAYTECGNSEGSRRDQQINRQAGGMCAAMADTSASSAMSGATVRSQSRSLDVTVVAGTFIPQPVLDRAPHMLRRRFHVGTAPRNEPANPTAEYFAPNKRPLYALLAIADMRFRISGLAVASKIRSQSPISFSMASAEALELLAA